MERPIRDYGVGRRHVYVIEDREGMARENNHNAMLSACLYTISVSFERGFDCRCDDEFQ